MVRANETPTENSITARASRACSRTLGVVRGVPLTLMLMVRPLADGGWLCWVDRRTRRSEEHTSELQSLMRISYAVFCLKKKKTDNTSDIDQPRIKHSAR